MDLLLKLQQPQPDARVLNNHLLLLIDVAKAVPSVRALAPLKTFLLW